MPEQGLVRSDGNITGKLQITAGIGASSVNLCDGDLGEVKDSGVFRVDFFVQDIVGVSVGPSTLRRCDVIASLQIEAGTETLAVGFRINTFVLSSASA